MNLKRFFTLICLLLLVCASNLRAEEFIAKRGIYEKKGQKTEVRNLSGLPHFHADYYPNENVVKIKCNAGNLILKRGTFFYAYRGAHKGLVITASAYVENGDIESIVYEEWDKTNDVKAILTYYKK